MMIMKKVVCAVLMLGAAKGALCQGYRGIIPLHSTCEDVKHSLGVSTCAVSNTYTLGNERIKISISKARCDKAWQKRWNIPPGTVMGIERLLMKPALLSDLNFDLSRYEKTRLTDSESTYISYEDGVMFTEAYGAVSSVAYGPTSKDYDLVCAEKSKSQHGDQIELPARWVDRYGDITFREEKKRLDLLAEEVKIQPPTSEIYFVLYYPRRGRKEAVLARAERAKNYLVRTHGINPARIKAVEGGLKKKLEIVFYIKPVM